MSVKPEVEFREKQNAHVPCRRIVIGSWPDPRGMRRHLMSPFDDLFKFVLQILGRRKYLLKNANEIIQCARVPKEVVANHRIARRTAKIDVSEVLVRFDALPFHSLNLLAEILEALPQGFQEKPCFFPVSFSKVEFDHGDLH